jgi:hypothetical protein
MPYFEKLFVCFAVQNPCESVAIYGEFNKTLCLSRFARRMGGHWLGKEVALPPTPSPQNRT